ncbi:hypothetical protein J1N35_021890 [Gossypium stocksii]|uniref:Uncharacterized protein n=1 Tax=Gossypium stocksii TaxID=47602 RepID=A0A9D3VHL6_9ROSI|nr:hypothetical protein J1N35_021890 [Gossypium stocksii]
MAKVVDSSVEIIGEEDDGGMPEDLSTKKVHLKEQRMASNLLIVVDLDPTPTVTWKDKLLGGSSTKGGVTEILELDRESDLEFVEGDIKKLDINGIPSIDFSKNGNQILVKDMALTNHGKKLCPTAKMVVVEEGEQSVGVRIRESDMSTESTDREVDSMNYSPWMLVEKKSRKKSREDRGFRAKN